MRIETTRAGGLRGPAGPRGYDGLSAYGVWLKEGNAGTPEDFLTSLKTGGRFAYVLHTGGQTVAPGGNILLKPRVSRGIEGAPGGVVIQKPGSFLIRYYICAKTGVFAVHTNGLEAPATRFAAHDGIFAVCAIEIATLPAMVSIANVSGEAVRLVGDSGAVDAYMHITSID